MLISRANERVKKIVGRDKIVTDGLVMLTDGMLGHVHLPVETSHWELRADLRRLALQTIRGDGLESFLLGTGQKAEGYSLTEQSGP